MLGFHSEGTLLFRTAPYSLITDAGYKASLIMISSQILLGFLTGPTPEPHDHGVLILYLIRSFFDEFAHEFRNWRNVKHRLLGMQMY